MNIREQALGIINEVYLKGAYANIALARELEKKDPLPDQDRRFLTELVYGTVKAGDTLDWIIARFANRPANKIAPVILNILRLGIYQIFFLDKIPASAAVNQAVELAKKYGHPGTVKFVNAVLRNAARNLDSLAYPDQTTQPAKYLAVKYYHPEWLVERWLKRLGFAETEAFCQANNITPPLSLRTNTLKTTRDRLAEQLTAAGMRLRPSVLVAEGLLCETVPALSKIEALKAGMFQIQDESSMMVAHVLDPQPGEFIIDACGAPGGKSTHIAALMNNEGKVISTDIHEHKLRLTAENARRLGIKIIETKLLDAVKLNNWYPAAADRVLVDAPCSGLGVLRRKPDSRWRKTPQMLADLPELQRSILLAAADCVKPGGILVYSTCTIEPAENEQVVRSFLGQRSDFILEDAGRLLPFKPATKMVQLWPHKDGVDGFFICRLARTRQGD